MISPQTLRELRLKAGLSQEQAEELCGYSKATISCNETGRYRGTIAGYEAILGAYGYEIKAVKKGMFEGEVIAWTAKLPEDMHPDMEADEALVAEYGRPLVTDKEYLVLSQEGEIVRSRLYLFEDGEIKSDGYYDILDPIAWMELPKETK